MNVHSARPPAPHHTHTLHGKLTNGGGVPGITGPGSPQDGFVGLPTASPWATSRGLVYSFSKMGQLPASCLHHGAVLQPRRGAVSEGTPLRPLPPGQVALSLQPEHVVAFCHIIYLGSQSPLRRSGRINMRLGSFKSTLFTFHPW